MKVNLMNKKNHLELEYNKYTAQLNELVNYSPNLPFLRSYGAQEFETGTPSFDTSNAVNFNRRNLTMVYPEGTDRVPSNFNPQIAWYYGCQFVCMHWQIVDDDMATYITKFKNHSFILKPCALRYKPPLYEKPVEQNPSLYFNTMQVSTSQSNTIQRNAMNSNIKHSKAMLIRAMQCKIKQSRIVQSKAMQSHAMQHAYLQITAM